MDDYINSHAHVMHLVAGTKSMGLKFPFVKWRFFIFLSMVTTGKKALIILLMGAFWGRLVIMKIHLCIRGFRRSRPQSTLFCGLNIDQ